MKTLKYYRKLDLKNEKNGHKMISLTRDFAFKAVFGNNKDI